MTTAREIAELMYWDVDPKPLRERNPTGEVIAAEIRKWNQQALRQYLAERRLLEALKLSK